ncbi:hypothetical protein PINS_up014533 [Pythium insidiosum]|nr:hypothetical protein PINS_up014533 [Pythium insidiosum]
MNTDVISIKRRMMAGDDAAWAYRRGTRASSDHHHDAEDDSCGAGHMTSAETEASEVYEHDAEDQDAALNLSEDAVAAHSQVLEMAATIEILTRDFENLQRELLDAYKKLQEYSAHDPRHAGGVGTTASGGIVANAIAKLRSGGTAESCGHEAELEELKRVQ